MPAATSNTIRVIATYFIIMHHVLWPAYNDFYLTHSNPLVWFVTLINQLGKPAVMFYILLSGIAFGRKDIRFLDLLRNRFIRILIPYLFFSIIYALKNDSLSSFWLDIWVGGSSYHLYFVPLIFSCYLFLPLFQKYADSRLFALFMFSTFLTGSFFIQSNTQPNAVLPGVSPVFSFLKNTSIVNLISLQWVSYLAYTIPLFYVGVYLSRQKPFSALTIRLALLFSILAYLLVYTDFLYRVGIFQESADRAGRIWRYAVVLYILALIGVFRRWNPENNRIAKYSEYSYAVYLIHPIFIDYSHTIILPLNLLITIVTSWGLLIACNRLLSPNSPIRLLLGLSRKQP